MTPRQPDPAAISGVVIDPTILLQMSGPDTFRKGEQLQQHNKVRKLSRQGEHFSGEVKGSYVYQVSIVLTPSVQCSCTCPAAESVEVCKHAVALGLALNEQGSHGQNADSDEQVLRRYFGDKTHEELLDDLIHVLERDEYQWKAMLLKARLLPQDSSPAELKKLVTRALPIRELREWGEVSRYFSAAEQQLASLWEVMDSLSIEDQWQLTEQVLLRLNKVLERVDDVGGLRFGIQSHISRVMPRLFAELPWSASRKAGWLFDRLLRREDESFSGLQDFVSVSAEVESCLLDRCLVELERMAAELQTRGNTEELSWRMNTCASPLLREARSQGNWREEVRLKGMMAWCSQDYQALARQCLDYGEGDDAEAWLALAKKVAGYHEKHECLRLEITLNQVLGKPDKAWQLGWQLFEQLRSFPAFEALQKLHDELGGPEPAFANRVEQVLMQSGDRMKWEALLAFYLSQQRWQEARDCTLNGTVSVEWLLKLADALVESQPQEALALHLRVIRNMLEYSDNQVYQQVIGLLQRLQALWVQHQQELLPFNQAVAELATAFGRKRNFVALLKQCFPESV